MKSIFCIFTLLAGLLAHNALAQPNVLGLPAVPQTPIDLPVPLPAASGAASAPAVGKGGKAVRPKAGASATAAPAAPLVNDAEAKSVLNGGVTMATSYTQTQANLRVTTNTVYQEEAQRKQALNAGRLVQRDLRMACGRQCKPAPMAAPKILPDGKLQFDLTLDGFNRGLNNDDMMNMLLGRPLAVGAADPAFTAMAAGRPLPVAAAAKPIASATQPPLARNPPAPPALPDTVSVTRSIMPGSVGQVVPAQ
jgi:hypothetical protein